MKDLAARGFFTIRAAGSKGVADIVALRHDLFPLLISAKKNGIIPPNERERLVAAAHSYCAYPVLAECSEPRVLRYWFVKRGPERTAFIIPEVRNA